MKNQHIYWTVERCESGRYCAELWRRPYNGVFLAATRAVSTRAAAAADGKRIFSGFQRHPSQVREAQ